MFLGNFYGAYSCFIHYKIVDLEYKKTLNFFARQSCVCTEID